MLNTKKTKNQKAKSRLLAGKKLIILSIVLLTTLSATLIRNISETQKKGQVKSQFRSSFENDIEQAKKLKLFSAKDYMENYERQKQAKLMLKGSLQRFERSHIK